MLRDPPVTGAGLSQLRADIRPQYGPPGSPPDARRAPAAFQTHMGATQIADEEGAILQFAVTPCRDASVYAGPLGASLKQAFIFSRADALTWTEEELMRAQCEEDDTQVDHLRSAIT